MSAVSRRMSAGIVLVLCVACFSDEPDTMEPDGGEVAATVQATAQLRFSAATVTIRVGESVRWSNTSNLVHTVTADAQLANDPSHVSLPAGAVPFNSGNIDPGGSFTRRFDVVGRYDYFCIPHETAGMLGTVIVTN